MTGVRRGFGIRLLAAGGAAALAWWLLRPEPPGPTLATPPPAAPSRELPGSAAPSPPRPALRSDSGVRGEPPVAGPREAVAEDPDLRVIRGFLEQALEEHFSRHKLSEEELDELAGSVLALREARRRLARLERRPEGASELARAREELARAATRFEEILDMSPAEFTETLARAAGGGLSDPDDREPVPPGEFLEELPAPAAP